jgi:hypothetical protein
VAKRRQDAYTRHTALEIGRFRRRKGVVMSTEKPRNPFIVNFCEALIKKRGLELSEENKEKELERMYNLYESMLGRRMVEALPEDKKAQYVAIIRDLGQLSFAKIEEIFADGVPDPQAIMKATLEEFSDIYLKNR